MTPTLLHSLVLLTDTQTPSPLPTQTVTDEMVTPGPLGFFAILFVGVITLLLIIDMVRRIRRTRYRAEVRERILAEQSESAPVQPRDEA